MGELDDGAAARPATEAAAPATRGLDRRAPLESVEAMLAADRGLVDKLHAERHELAAAVELIAARLAAGGRLFYVGAGTSGRLGVLDAVECPPTFCTDPELVQGVLAGGDGAMWRAVEGAEDDAAAGGRDLAARGAGAADVVVGIMASGRTPYVHGALAWARAAGAATVALVCVTRAAFEAAASRLTSASPSKGSADGPDVVIALDTGPEALAGSTRLRAGTATKMALNMLSTLAMARLGRVHDNLMVDVNTRGNAKLWQRGIALVAELAGCPGERAEALLQAADGRVKTAVVMGRLELPRAAAEARLAAAGGFLAAALGQA